MFPPWADAPPDVTWETLVAPLAVSAEVTRGYVLEAPVRGHEHDVVWIARDAAGRVVEVHAVDREHWPSAIPTPSFGVDYEGPRTTAPEADAVAVTEALAEAIRANDPGGARVDEVPLGEGDGGRGLLSRMGTRRAWPIWAPLAALATAAVHRSAPAREAVGLFVVALALRLGLGAWGPFNVNGQGSKWLAGALNPADIANYGPGYAELYGAVARLGPPSTGIFAANAVVSALIPVAVWSVARALGWDRGRALFAAALLVVDPVSLRAAASETYLVPIGLLTTWVAWLALADRPAAWLAIALLGAQLARLHPSAWAPLAVAPLLAWSRGPGAVARALVAAGAGALLCSGAVVADVLAAIDRGTLIRPVVSPGTVAWAVVPSLLCAAAPRARPLLPAVLAASLADLALRGTYDQSAVWQAAFDRLYVVPLALGAAAWLPDALLGRPRLAGPALAVAAAVALVVGRPLVSARTTDDAEHAWAQQALSGLPSGCRVLYVSRPDPVVTVLLPPWPGLELVGVDAQGPVNLAPYLRGDCVRYVRTSACATRSGVAGCDRVESLLPRRTELARASLPAAPSHRSVTYRSDPVEVVLFSVP